MNFDDPQQRQVFFEVHRDLPREAPGSTASTRRALALVAGRLDPEDIQWVVDVACGPGAQTLDLAAALPQARFLALDLHMPFLRDVVGRTTVAGLAERVSPVCGDMGRLPVAAGGADLIWCEGAAYTMGVAQALASWHEALRPGGCAAFTDAVWLRHDVPAAVTACWAEYPAMTDCDGVVRWIEAAGFEALPPFVLPAAAWLDGYYGPMEARLDALEARYAGDPAARAVLEESREEIAVYRQHGDCYGYAFFVAHKRR